MNNNNQNYDMIDEIIDTVIKKSDDKIIEAESRLLDERLNGMPDVSLSADFEKRMSKLFAAERRKQRKKTYTKYGRIAAIFVAAVLVVSVVSILSVDAWRMKFYNKFIHRDDSGTDISLVESVEEGGLEIENITVQYIPDGFALKQIDKDDDGEIYFLLFENNENKSFSLDVSNNSDSISVNSEDADVEKILIKGYDAFLNIDNIKNESIIIYNDDKYFYTIAGSIETSELINIANGFSKN